MKIPFKRLFALSCAATLGLDGVTIYRRREKVRDWHGVKTCTVPPGVRFYPLKPPTISAKGEKLPPFASGNEAIVSFGQDAELVKQFVQYHGSSQFHSLGSYNSIRLVVPVGSKLRYSQENIYALFDSMPTSILEHYSGATFLLLPSSATFLYEKLENGGHEAKWSSSVPIIWSDSPDNKLVVITGLNTAQPIMKHYQRSLLLKVVLDKQFADEQAAQNIKDMVHHLIASYSVGLASPDKRYQDTVGYGDVSTNKELGFIFYNLYKNLSAEQKEQFAKYFNFVVQSSTLKDLFAKDAFLPERAKELKTITAIFDDQGKSLCFRDNQLEEQIKKVNPYLPEVLFRLFLGKLSAENAFPSQKRRLAA